MNFDGDAFISYAQLDNVALKEGSQGWIANLHRALQVRVGQLLGKEAHIWRDPKRNDSDMFVDTLVERLGRVAALVSVVSPAYVKSEWTKRELAEFWKAAEAQGGVRFGDKARVFKVLKTPVPLEKQSPELQHLLGYEFFKVDTETGRVRELDEAFGAEAQVDFWVRLDDLAHDICCVLEMLEGPQQTVQLVTNAESRAVFLAEVTSDLAEQRDAIKRDLVQHGYTVLPARALPAVASAVTAAIREDLSRCRMSIHLMGKSYSFVPEGGAKSLLEIQNELAIERGENGQFSRLLWIPIGLQVEDKRQQKVIEQVRMDPRIHEGADLLETGLEDLRTVIQDRLKRPNELIEAAGRDRARVYVMYDPRDANAISPWVDFLFERGLEVISPIMEGDEAEIRKFHEQNLRTCDGALILYGAANECWVRRKLRELQKSVGYSRASQMPVVAIVLTSPKTAEKERFRTHEAIMIPQWYGLSPDPFGAFISRSLRHQADSLLPPPSKGASTTWVLPVLESGVLKSGTKLGPYEILALLGVGGMGEVYRAHDPRLGRDVALKVLPTGLLADEVARGRFYREAKALAMLNHPHIAVIHDVGQEAGVDYLVMECVSGESLAEKLKSGALAENEVVSLGEQIAEALQEAHEQGVVHRDLKPANIMVTAKGQVKVLDFGLAKLLVSTESFTDLQSTAGTVAGTLPYMAPEQLRGESADARVDIYALGAVLFEMAFGRRAFQESLLMRLIEAILHQPPPFPRPFNPQVSAELERIIAKTLEKNRDLRYQNAADLRADLAHLKRNTPSFTALGDANIRKGETSK